MLKTTSFHACWILRFLHILVAPFVITSVAAEAEHVSLSVTSAKAVDGTRQILSVSGFSPDSCNAHSIDTISIKLNPSSNETHTFTFKDTSDPSSFWFGMEAEEDPVTGDTVPMYLGGSASLCVSTREAVPGVCFISGRFFAMSAYRSLVVGTYPNGTVWGETIIGTGPEGDEGDDLEYKGPGLPNLLASQDDGSVIDLLVVYTREAMCSLAGAPFPCDFTPANSASIENQIDFLVAECNTILQVSGLTGDVAMSVTLADAYMDEDYSENGLNFTTTNIQMATANDGFFENPDLLALRESLCADLVILITLNTDVEAYGQASGIGPNPSFYTLVASLDPEATAGFTFTHELGHVLGCRHDNDFDGYTDFNRGFVVPMQYSTIMGRRDNCNCPGNRLPVFSDADKLYNGLVIGNASYDNVRWLETARVDVAKFRDSAICDPALPPTPAPTPNGMSTCGIFRKVLGICQSDILSPTCSPPLLLCPEQESLCPFKVVC